ncbi:RNA polymerase sigma factor [Vibrio hepatarius]|uniref:RNA polymerase sigma factor n=1 Tax=Vibrio hepatarius TaxID=171383 RepID=UPI0037353635
MNNAPSKTIAVSHVINDVLSKDRGRLLAGLISRLGDFQVAEDALQEASIAALKHWTRSGPPHNPAAWLLRVGLNKGIDHFRMMQREQRKAGDHADIFTDDKVYDVPETIPDERLRLIFTCCHPALEEKSRIALTLRTVCNLTTKEIAAAFLDSEHTMGQRLYRAKAKIKAKGIRFSIPEADRWHDRLDTVLTTIYLIFTTGYVMEAECPRSLCQEGIFLARLLNKLRPNDPEIEGALALMLLTDARSTARINDDGAMVPIEEQNTSLWQQNKIDDAQRTLSNAIEKRQPGPFQIKAAITDCHMTRPSPDWYQMSLLYQSLWRFEPTPVVALNWAVVIAETERAELALKKLDELKEDLKDYQPWYAARAHILSKLGQKTEASIFYKLAIERSLSVSTRKFLKLRLRDVKN